MGDRFYDVDTGLSAMNAGRLDVMENDLMEAPEDGDIDELNDETFGGGGEWDEDWEEQHEKLAEEVEAGQDFFQQDMIQNGHQPDSKFKDRQEDLEQSLSQLVVDDEDDVVDPAIVNTSRYQPIHGQRGKVNLDNLFGPSSPPGFLNTEHLVSPDKANIWGSPTTREEVAGMVAREGGGINNLLRILQQQQKTRQNVSPQQDPSILVVGKPLPMVPGKIHSVEELEKNLLKEKPHPIMASDLERQMERSSSGPMSIPPPHMRHPPGPQQHQQQQHPSNKNMPLMPPPVMPGHDMMEGSQQNSFPHPRGIPIPGARPRMPHQDVAMSCPLPCHLDSHSPIPYSNPPCPSSQPTYASSTPIAKFFRQLAENNPVPAVSQQNDYNEPKFNLVQQLHQSMSPKLGSAPTTSHYGVMMPHSSTPIIQRSMSVGSAPDRFFAPAVGEGSPQFNSSPSSSPLFFNMSMDSGQTGRSNGTPPLSYPNPTPSPPLTMFPRKPSPLLQNLSVTSALLAAKLQLAKSLLPKLIGSGGLSGSSPSSHNQGLPSFLANTPVKQQRGPMHMGMSDPTHLVRPRSNGPFPPHLKQNLFNHDHMSPGDNSFNSDRPFHHHNGSYSSRDKQMPFLSEMDHEHQGSPRQHGHYQNDRYYSHGPPHPRDGRENRSYSYEGRGDGRPRGRGWGHHQGHRHYQWQHHQRPYNFDRGSGDQDEYAHLMTQKEKDWIVKIQLMQLHTENPYLDDYYYTTWNLNRLANEREKRKQIGGKDDKELQLVIPQLAKLESRTYKPIQFEGSLGRLTASSVHNPRQIIEVAINSSTDVEEPKQGRRFKRLLMYIEDHYNLLLDIDDIEKKALALPEEMRPTLYQQRKNFIAELHKSFHCDEDDDLMERMVSIRKGVSLMARLMMLLDRTQARNLMRAILSHLHFFMKKDYHETYGKLFESMWRCLAKGKFEDLVVWAEAISSCAEKFLPFTAMLQNQFASSAVWGLLIRGEDVYKSTSPVDMEVEKQSIWTSFVQNIGEALNTDLKLATPSLFSAACLQHLERLLDKKTWLSIEDKLAVFTS